MPTIRVLVPEAYALDHQGRQLDRLVVKNARSRQDMEPQLSTFIHRWSLPQGNANHSIPTRSNHTGGR